MEQNDKKKHETLAAIKRLIEQKNLISGRLPEFKVLGPNGEIYSDAISPAEEGPVPAILPVDPTQKMRPAIIPIDSHGFSVDDEDVDLYLEAKAYLEEYDTDFYGLPDAVTPVSGTPFKTGSAPIGVVPAHTKNSFFVQNGQLYYKEEQGMQPVKVANFYLSIDSEMFCFSKADLNGDRESYSVYCMIIYIGLEKYKVKITSDELESCSWNAASHGKGFVYKKSLFLSYIEERISASDYPVSVRYADNGWIKTESGELVYLTSWGVIGYPKLNISSDSKHKFLHDEHVSPRDCALMLDTALSVTHDGVVPSILLLETFLGSLNSLFELAGYPNKKGVFVIGPTQSCKTTLALLLCKILDRDNIASPELSFSSTPGGIEEKLAEISDATVILDDLSPKIDKAEESKILSKLETATRAVGDRVSKKRMSFCSRNKEAVSYPIKSSLIITGEMISGAQSSLARLVQVHLNRSDIDFNILTFLQQHPLWISTLIFHFIHYISQKPEATVEHIRYCVPLYRGQMHGKFHNSRFGEYLAVYMTVIDLISAFLQSIGLAELALRMSAQLSMNAEKVLLENDIAVLELTPEALLIEALRTAIDTGELQVSKISSAAIANTKCAYLKDAGLAVYPETLLRIVTSYAEQHGKGFANRSSKGLSQLLAASGFITPTKEGTGVRYTHKITGFMAPTNLRFYILNLSKLNIELPIE